MTKIILFLLLVAPIITFSQEWIDDSYFEDKIVTILTQHPEFRSDGAYGVKYHDQPYQTL